MKKFIILIFLIFFIAFSPTSAKKTSAQENLYSHVLTTNTGFYSDANGNYLKFYLPYSYYVRVIEIGDVYTKVHYMETNASPFLTGYVKNVDLIGVNKIPQTPYPIVTLTVIKDDILFSDSSLTTSRLGVYANTTATFYGEITSPKGESLVYVCCSGYLGYVRKSAFAPYEIPLNPDYKEENSSATPEKEVENKKTHNLQILIIAGISIVVVSLVYVIFKPSDKRVREMDED